MFIILLKSRYKSCKNIHLYLWISKCMAYPSLIYIFASTSFLFLVGYGTDGTQCTNKTYTACSF